MEHCVAGVVVYRGLIAILDANLCPKPPSVGWHSKDYLFDDCLSCGIVIFPMCLTKDDTLSPKTMHQEHYNMQSITTKKGLQRRKL